MLVNFHLFFPLKGKLNNGKSIYGKVLLKSFHRIESDVKGPIKLETRLSTRTLT